MNKRALSPVIATALLIALVLALALIIYLWASSFLPEQLQKSGTPIQDQCPEVNLIIEYSIAESRLSILNNGNVPVYGVKVGIRKGFSLEYINQDFTAQPSIGASQVAHFDIEPGNAPSVGDQLVVVPILLGKNTKEQLKSFTCDVNYGWVLDVTE